jgi:hypothetical protein
LGKYPRTGLVAPGSKPCGGKNLGGIPDVYHPDFVDHVNVTEYRGHEGARRFWTES